MSKINNSLEEQRNCVMSENKLSSVVSRVIYLLFCNKSYKSDCVSCLEKNISFFLSFSTVGLQATIPIKTKNSNILFIFYICAQIVFKINEPYKGIWNFFYLTKNDSG